MIVQVKENQKKLLASCEKTAQEIVPVDTFTSRDQGRNRKERRTVRVFNTFKWVSHSVKVGWNNLIGCIIEVTRVKRVFDTKTRAWKKSVEIAYYVGTSLFSSAVCTNAIREHWWIENKDHYVRDVSMKEDWSRIRKNPDKMVVLRSIALNTLRVNGVKNVQRTLFENGLSLEKVLTYKKI